MLKVGIIGSVRSVASHVHQIRSIPGIQVIGKSSVGMMEQSEVTFHSIPEFNRKDLVEAADILIIDQTPLIYPDLLIFAIKNNKHLFINDFPDLSPDACLEILKLAEEAQTAVHIKNPPGDEPLTGWALRNRREPAYMSMFEIMPQLPDKKMFLIRHLFYAMSFFNTFPLKIRATGIQSADSGFYFINVRFDYPTHSAFNLELLIQPETARHLKIVMPGKFLSGDCLTGKVMLNLKEVTTGFPGGDSLIEFLSQPENGSFYSRSNLNIYHSALQTLQYALRKIELYTPWR